MFYLTLKIFINTASQIYVCMSPKAVLLEVQIVAEGDNRK